ncbi:FlxA-like family protein [Paenibacillus sp. sgz5001063]|uniref:FlxA-like family protein n=1 Tax=Paenibacillus sp. sgz5001063 TaxID=3242474 RepID=UPI0036D31179
MRITTPELGAVFTAELRYARIAGRLSANIQRILRFLPGRPPILGKVKGGTNMNISSISSASSTTYTSSSATDTAALEKQKAKLEADLEKVASSKDDEKTKETKTKQIEQQIKQIEAQIAQKSQSQSSSSARGSATPPEKPAGGKTLVPASAQDIATATTDSEGRFDIRV